MKGKTIEQLTVLDIADQGRALCKHEGRVIFVDKALPGDVVDVLITRKQKSYLEGRVVKQHVSSSYRVEAFCKHFGVCGGCKWQHMDYAAQLMFKQKQVFDSMKRLGRITEPNVSPIIGSAETKFYRNKLDFSFADKQWLSPERFATGEVFSPGLGFHIPGMFDKVLDIDECWLQPEPSNAIRLAVKEYALALSPTSLYSILALFPTFLLNPSCISHIFTLSQPYLPLLYSILVLSCTSLPYPRAYLYSITLS